MFNRNDSGFTNFLFEAAKIAIVAIPAGIITFKAWCNPKKQKKILQQHTEKLKELNAQIKEKNETTKVMILALNGTDKELEIKLRKENLKIAAMEAEIKEINEGMIDKSLEKIHRNIKSLERKRTQYSTNIAFRECPISNVVDTQTSIVPVNQSDTSSSSGMELFLPNKKSSSKKLLQKDEQVYDEVKNELEDSNTILMEAMRILAASEKCILTDQKNKLSEIKHVKSYSK